MNNERIQVGYLDVFNDLNSKNIQIGAFPSNSIYVDGDGTLIISGEDNTPAGMQLILADTTNRTSITFDPDYHSLVFEGNSYTFYNQRPQIYNTGNFTFRDIALSDEVVSLTGNETISGIKTFSNGIISSVGITGTNLVYNTGDQTISGNKSFINRIYLNNENDVAVGGTYLEGNISGISLKTFQQPTDIKIRSDFVGGNNEEVISIRNSYYTDPIFGPSINTAGFGDQIVIYQTGSTYGVASSKGPYLRLGDNNIISEKSTSKLGIGTLFPTEKVHVSGGNLKIEGNAIANNLVYNTGNQTISGVKTFSNTIEIYAPGTLAGPFIATISGAPIYDGEIMRLDISSYQTKLKSLGGDSITIGDEEGRLDINTVADTSTFNLGYNHNSSSTGIYNITSPSINLYGQVDGKTGTFQKLYAGNLVYNTGTQTISGVKTFATGIAVSGNLQVSGSGSFDGLDLNSIDIISLSGVDVTITSGVVTLTNPLSAPNLVYNTGNQTISGIKTFATGIFDKASGNLILFNSATAPLSPAKGQLFFDTINNNFSGYNGTSWLKLNN